MSGKGKMLLVGIVLWGVVFFFGWVGVNRVSAQCAAGYTCSGSNAYLRVGQCVAMGSGCGYCGNSNLSYNYPVTCGANCAATTDNGGGCSGPVPQGPCSLWSCDPILDPYCTSPTCLAYSCGTCPDPADGGINCCLGTAPTSVPPTLPPPTNTPIPPTAVPPTGTPAAGCGGPCPTGVPPTPTPVPTLVPTATPPAGPLTCTGNLGVTCAGSGTTSTITWDAVAGAVLYYVRLNKVGCTWFSPACGDQEFLVGTTSLTATVVAGQAYKVDVQGVKAGESTPYSGCVAPVPPFQYTCNVNPSCSVAFNPSSISVQQGGPTVNTNLNVTLQNGAVSTQGEYSWLSGGAGITFVPASGISTVGPNYPIGLSASSLAPLGVSSLLGKVYLAVGPACINTASVTVIPLFTSWWQVKAGGVVAYGDLRSQVPKATPAPILIQGADSSDVPGVAVGNPIDPYWLSSDNVSTAKWLVGTSGYPGFLSTGLISKYSYSYFKTRMLSAVVPYAAGSGYVNLSDSYVGAIPAGNKIGGVAYLQMTGPVTISGGDLAAGSKTVLFVDGNVTITGKISVQNDGFFMLLASGDILLNGDTVGEVGDPKARVADLAGIYFAGGVFRTGSTTTGRTLRVDGSVVGLAGVELTRDVKSYTEPAEYFVFRPDLIMQFPVQIMRRHIVQELGLP